LLPNPKARLQDQFHEVARLKHLSLRTEQSYWEWVVRYLRFHRERAGLGGIRIPFENPNGIMALSPAVAKNELPWVNRPAK